jgi:hypothetical protein
MSKTAVADIIIPEIFERYSIQQTAVLSEFFQSGIVENNTDFDMRANGGGQTVKMPFFNDLTAGRQILSDSGSLSVNKITTGQDIARLQNTAQAWSVNLLAELLSGEDPMAAIATLVGAYWARTMQDMLINTLQGVFGSASMSGNLLGIHSESVATQSEATKLTGTTFIDALVKLGDRADRLTAMAMHSATEAALRKRDLIDFIPDSEGKAKIRTFQGRTVIVDDRCPVRAGTTDGQVFTTYIFGAGAVANGNGTLDGTPLQGGFGTEALEFARVALDSDNVMINRKRMILHPRGIKFNSAVVAGDSPTDAELANQANWTRVYDNKNVRMVAVTHNN